MELGQYQLQIFVSLLVVLGAAFVALICDFLKGNNEQLRELTIELKVRREEEQRRSQMMTARAMAAPATEQTMLEDSTGGVQRDKRIHAPAARAVAKGAAAARGVAVAGPSSRDMNRKRPISPAALAVFERGEKLAASPRSRKAATAAPRPVINSPSDEEVLAAISMPDELPVRTEASMTSAPASKVNSRETEPVLNSIASENTITMVQSSSASKKDWSSLLSRKSAGTPARSASIDALSPAAEVRADLLDAVVAATASGQAQSDAEAFPAGFHDGFVLSRLVQSRQPVSGLVVSIGVNTPRNADGSLPEAVRQLIQSLIGPEDFACQSNREEFLLIYPHERGASAQRRLSGIAQRLWDFQLRSMGTFSILFSWGGVEVRSESIDEAIASANERMQETRRGRKLLTMELRGDAALRQAV